MSKTKKTTPLAKTTSILQRRINNLRKLATHYRNAVEKRKKQSIVYTKFEEKLREKNPKLYWEIVAEMGWKPKPKA